ncbi:MAG: apolipoprotein N-acyltransferase [Ichthyobacteriaceae bacterium]|nr:apolipoprotein N-acyltransferase [Ichthyobacteriaceae bacterium]
MKNIILSIIAGLLLSFSWPTNGFAGLLFIAFIPLLYITQEIYKLNQKKSGYKVFGLAYITFVIWNFYTTWWLHNSDFYAGLFAVLANSALLALVWRLYFMIKKRAGNHLSFMFLPAIWIAFEKLHLMWEISWPWLNLGNGFAEYYKWIQWYEYTGAFGGTFWVLLVNITLFAGLTKYLETSDVKKAIPALIRGAVFIVIPISYSYYVYNTYSEKGEKTEVVVLQPNIDPYKNKFDTGDEELGRQLIELANQKVTSNTSFVFGPETSLPDGMNINAIKNYRISKEINNFTKTHNNTTFVTGATLVNFYSEENKTETSNRTRNGKHWYDIYNTAIRFGKNLDSIDLYHKSKLVVGVENMPFREVIQPLLGDFIINLGGTVGTHVTQKERSVFADKNKQIYTAPVICYESVYGEFVTGYVNNGANMLSVITNDGWWGNSQGHKQHLSFSRLRAIENRRPVARSANTGISALINQKGDIIKSLEYGKKGAIKGDIILNNELTIYTLFGDYIARVAVLIAGIIFVYALTVKKKSMVY